MTTFKTPKGTELPFIELKGKLYLQVMHRLVWFREEKPEWSIQTEFPVLTETHAIARASIYNEKGVLLSTAHKREDAKHFPDFMEKAETGAIGRALALIGYGTQFAPELEEGERIVDSPVPNRSHAMPLPQKPSYPLTPKENQPQRVGGISEAQGKRMFAIAKSHQWNTETMQNYIAWKYGVTHSRDLSREQYDDLCNNVLPNKEIAIQEMNEGGQAPLLFDGDASL